MTDTFTVVDQSGRPLRTVLALPEGNAEGQVGVGEKKVPPCAGFSDRWSFTAQSWVARPSAVHEWDPDAEQWAVNLDAAKADRWAAIKLDRDGREFGAFTWSGHAFDGDRDSQRRINLALMKAKAAFDAGEDWSIDWTLADNTVLTLSAAEVIAVVQALGDNIDAAHEWARVRRAQIEAASTLDEVLAVS